MLPKHDAIYADFPERILLEIRQYLQEHSGITKLYSRPFLEADYLADKIKRLHEDGVAWENIAVFYRMQRQSKTLEDVFLRKGIPFTVSVRKTLSDILVLQWLVRLLSAAMNENDRNSLISVLTDARFGEGLTMPQARKMIIPAADVRFMKKSGAFPAGPPTTKWRAKFTAISNWTDICRRPRLPFRKTEPGFLPCWVSWRNTLRRRIPVF